MSILVLVESPKKAKQIEKYLGSGYRVLGTAGHVRDLPANKAQVPAEIAAEPWGYLGINPETFRPYYIIHPDKHALVKQIKSEAKKAEKIYYATDADREGEAIAWHLAQVLGDKNPVRMTFTEITREAIHAALGKLRPLDLQLVQAQEARRMIDRLSGYAASRAVWKSVRPGLSAGRIQSPALTILAQREMARMRFKPASFFVLKADADTDPRFRLTVTHMRRKDEPYRPLARAGDYTPEGVLKADADVLELNEEQAGKLYDYLLKRPGIVSEIIPSRISVAPQPPFITATLQQAGARLGLKVAELTKIAQSLYESGFITYIRTDSTSLSEEAVEGARAEVMRLYGAAALPEHPRSYATKNKSAQEAHEAIRPAGHHFKEPASTGLLGKELEVYDLIYRRTLACQMENAEYDKTAVKVECGVLLLQASGRVMVKAGYTQALSDDPTEKSDDDDQGALPQLSLQQSLPLIPLRPEVSRSKPPGRFSETSLTKLLDANGIGRPSTLPNLITTLEKRGYTVPIGKNNLAESAEGLLTSAYLTKYLTALTEKEFTAHMEEGLDDIAQGKRQAREYLKTFWTDQLAPMFAQAPVKAPQLKLPHLDGVRLGATLDGPVIRYGERQAPIAPEAIPAELTMKDVQDILDGKWQAGKKSSAPRGGSKSGSKSGSKPRRSAAKGTGSKKPKA